jgi:hypothetical protein
MTARGSPKPSSAAGSAAPARNFTLTGEERMRAAIAGPPAYALRKRRIEDMEEALVAKLVELEVEAQAEHDDEARARGAFLRAAARLDLTRINALVETHNRYYPCEANLPMDLAGAPLERGRPWRPLELVTLEGLLAAAKARAG